MEGADIPSPRPHTRADLDGLRAIAVLAIVAFHAFPQIVRGGFIGVDIFFVLSGFLISTLILEGLETNSLSFGDFYARRVTRIVPALIVVLTACIGIGWFVLVPQEFMQLGKHVAAGATPAVNFVFWSEGGYFDELSTAKPLIHLWSLGIEEQFYLAWPALVWLCRKKPHRLLGITLGLAALSFALNIALTRHDPAAAFYSPAPRLWELLAGGLVAYASFHRRNWFDAVSPILRNALSLTAGAGIVAGALLLPKAAAFPGWRVLVPTLGTAILIAAGERAWLNRMVLARPALVGLGLISYPLYLWHWPLLSFAWIATGDMPPAGIRGACVVLAIGLAWATWRFIEKPIRSRLAPGGVKALLLVAGLAATGCAGLFIYGAEGFRGRMAQIVAYNAVPEDRALSTPGCLDQFHDLYGGRPIKGRDFCLRGDTRHPPAILLIGDSHAVQLYKGFHSLGVNNAAMFGRGSCAPVLNAPNVSWLACQPTQDRLIDFAIHSDARLLILTGVFERYFDGTYGDIPLQNLETNIRRTFEKLGAAKKPVLVVLDNPGLPFRASLCFKRPVSFHAPRDCSFDRRFYESKTAGYQGLFRKYAGSHDNIRLLDISGDFCDARKCRARNDQGLLYVGDNNRLNMRGAGIVDRQIMALYPDLFRK